MEVSGGETLAFISFPPHKDLPPAVIEKKKEESGKLELRNVLPKAVVGVDAPVDPRGRGQVG